MSSFSQSSVPPLRLAGQGKLAYLLAIVLLIVGIVIIINNPLTAGWLIPIFAGSSALFVFIGRARQQTSLELLADRLIEKSRSHTTTIILATITAVSLRTTLHGRSVQRAVVWWQGQSQIAAIVLDPYPTAQFCDFLREVHHRQPHLPFDRELEQYLHAHTTGTAMYRS